MSGMSSGVNSRRGPSRTPDVRLLREAGRRWRRPDTAGDNLWARMMEFDADKDGKLTREEVTDERLTCLLDACRRRRKRDGRLTDPS